MFDSKGLKTWFLKEQRDLPWRHERSPYSVWVSEMMLQQTQVSVVIPYFLRWMERFPNIKTLAEAPLDEVIKIWEGLGYYSRARFLHEGAKYVLKHYEGQFPSQPEELRKIKGLGPYTQGAVRSFAFHHRVPAVDGNVVRVLSRYFQITEDIGKTSTMRQIWSLAEQMLPENDPWIVSEALIELGATICTKLNPKCTQCPLRNGCKSFAHGVVEKIPFKSKKVKSESLYRAVAVVKWNDLFLVRRGQTGEIMSDLHEFPYFETDTEGVSDKALQKRVQDWLGCEIEMINALEEVSHSFTRYRVRLRPVSYVCNNKIKPKVDAPHFWISNEGMQKVAFSSGHRRVLNQLLLVCGYKSQTHEAQARRAVIS